MHKDALAEVSAGLALPPARLTTICTQRKASLLLAQAALHAFGFTCMWHKARGGTWPGIGARSARVATERPCQKCMSELRYLRSLLREVLLGCVASCSYSAYSFFLDVVGSHQHARTSSSNGGWDFPAPPG